MIERDRQFMMFGLSPDRYSGRGVWLFLGIYFGSLLFAGLVAPIVYAVMQSMAEGNPDGVAASLVARSFDKFVDRCRYVPLLVCLPWLMLQVGLAGRAKGFWASNDMNWRPGSGLSLVYGLALGLALTGLIVIMQMVFTSVSMGDPRGFGSWLGVIAGALLAAVLVGVIEEILFRSLIFRIFYTAMKPRWAICVASFIYAYLHFRAPGHMLAGPNADPGFVSGLQIAGMNALGGFLNFQPVEFFVYFSLGVLFCVLYLRSRTLWAPIGLHAGIVFVMMLYKKSMHIHADPREWIFAGGGLTEGIVPGIITLALAALFSLRLPVSRS